MLLYLLGVAVFAVSGALVATRKSMDLLGGGVIAVVTTIGGGTIRDGLLDRHPTFWIGDATSPFVITAVAVATLVYLRFHELPFKALLIADAFGLALFTVSGAQIAKQATLPAIIFLVMPPSPGPPAGPSATSSAPRSPSSCTATSTRPLPGRRRLSVHGLDRSEHNGRRADRDAHRRRAAIL